MNHADHVQLIEKGIDRDGGGIWVDFGAGSGAFTLGLKGSFGTVTATLDAAPVTVSHTADGIELALTLSAGQHQLRFPRSYHHLHRRHCRHCR